ncbi:MAG: hypothetical protein ACJ739_06405 [Acidimicrobiales bacterium]
MLLINLLERMAAARRQTGRGGIWTGIAFGTFLYRIYQRRAHRDVITLREQLNPGESILITHTTQRQG